MQKNCCYRVCYNNMYKQKNRQLPLFYRPRDEPVRILINKLRCLMKQAGFCVDLKTYSDAMYFI